MIASPEELDTFISQVLLLILDCQLSAPEIVGALRMIEHQLLAELSKEDDPTS